MTRLLAVVGSVFLLTAGYATANHESLDYWLHCAGSPQTCTEEAVPTVTETSTVTGPTTTETTTVTTTVTVTTTEPPPPPPSGPTVVVPTPTIPVGAITVTPATISSQLASAPSGSTLVADAGTYSGDYVITRLVHLVGRPNSVFTGHIRVQIAGWKLLGGLEIDGTGKTVDNACVWVERADVLIEKTEIHDCYADGIFANSGSSRLTIRDNWIHHNGRVVTANVPQRHGVYFSGGVDAVMTNNVIEDNQGNGLQIKGTTTNLQITRNSILRNGSKQWLAHQGANGIILDSSGVSGTLIQGNEIALNTETGIRKLSTTGSNNRITGNTHWQNTQGSCPIASTFSSSSNFTFFCAGLVDGGGNLIQAPLTNHSYGSTLYTY